MNLYLMEFEGSNLEIRAQRGELSDTFDKIVVKQGHTVHPIYIDYTYVIEPVKKLLRPFPMEKAQAYLKRGEHDIWLPTNGYYNRLVVFTKDYQDATGYFGFMCNWSGLIQAKHIK